MLTLGDCLKETIILDIVRSSGRPQGSKLNLVIFCIDKVWKYTFSTTLYDMEHHFIESRYDFDLI